VEQIVTATCRDC